MGVGMSVLDGLAKCTFEARGVVTGTRTEHIVKSGHRHRPDGVSLLCSPRLMSKFRTTLTMPKNTKSIQLIATASIYQPSVRVKCNGNISPGGLATAFFERTMPTRSALPDPLGRPY